MAADGSLSFSGDIIVSERLPMNAEIELSFTSCSLDRVGCTSLHKMNIPRVCEKMATKTSIAYKIISFIQPTLKCPVDVGTYHLMMTNNLPMAALLLPRFEGYLMVVRTLFFEKNSRKRVRPLACAEYEILSTQKSNANQPKGRK